MSNLACGHPRECKFHIDGETVCRWCDELADEREKVRKLQNEIEHVKQAKGLNCITVNGGEVRLQCDEVYYLTINEGSVILGSVLADKSPSRSLDDKPGVRP